MRNKRDEGHILINPRKGAYAVRLVEIHEQKWFPQFLRDEFVDELQMIPDITNTYQPIAKLLRKRLQQCGANSVLDLCSGAGGPWPSLVRDFQTAAQHRQKCY